MTRYRTIVADPPWDVKAGAASAAYTVGPDGVQVWNLASTKSRPLAYPSMTVEAICALPVADVAERDAHLYLWTTNGYLPAAFRVIEAWGFTYSTTIVWCKTPFGGGGLGGKWRITTEFLLHATRGSLAATGQIIGTWFHEKRPYEGGFPKHSAKPDSFQDRIEQVSPGPYLELFQRRSRLAWDGWGDEALQHVDLRERTLAERDQEQGKGPSPRTVGVRHGSVAGEGRRTSPSPVTGTPDLLSRSASVFGAPA